MLLNTFYDNDLSFYTLVMSSSVEFSLELIAYTILYALYKSI